ncbi:MAG: DUF4404 family protein [Verrucomicrobiales bacterium]|nr:DUF4404 family protein [Verrucomicrobiales bacterium]
MKRSIEDIREALRELQANDDESEAALNELLETVSKLEDDPRADGIRIKLESAAADLKRPRKEDDDEPSGASKLLEELQEELSEWGEDHPTIVMAVSRLANALAVAGL